ncbi:hypothetical protein BBJ28_00003595 [Nothophytophthora sp. Chile5]|nr:hypothetical protein BBJ28_00003595 [Nothophytophthora sp. Chile5]
MMTSDSGVPDVVRLAGEETSFLRREVEAPKRPGATQLRATSRRKRAAVTGVSVAALLALAAICSFVASPSDGNEAVESAASEAMASEPAFELSTETPFQGDVFIPDFAVYDENGDATVSSGEFLDRLAINREAARQRLDASELNVTQKTQIAQFLDEDFVAQSDCVALFGQQHSVTMKEGNFAEMYDQIAAACLAKDSRIPEAYQPTEVATGQDELLPVPRDSQWDPDVPTDPPLSSSAAVTQSSDGGQWAPDVPTDPPVSSYGEEGEPEGSSEAVAQTVDNGQWNPDAPTDSPTSSSSELEDGSAATTQPSDESQWNPDVPTDPPVSSSAAVAQSDDGGEWKPDVPTDPPMPLNDGEGGPEDGSKTAVQTSDGGEWNPDIPTDLPVYSASDEEKPEDGSESPGLSNDDGQWHPETPTDPPVSSNGDVTESNADGGWDPDTPTDPPLASTGKREPEEDSTVTSQSNDESQWSPDVPTDPPMSSGGDGSKAVVNSVADGEWSPDTPTDPPVSSAGDADRLKDGSAAAIQPSDDGQWHPDNPTDSPVSSTSAVDQPSGNSEWNPDAPTDSPLPSSGKEGEYGNQVKAEHWSPEMPTEAATFDMQPEFGWKSTAADASDRSVDLALREAEKAWLADKERKESGETGGSL